MLHICVYIYTHTPIFNFFDLGAAFVSVIKTKRQKNPSVTSNDNWHSKFGDNNRNFSLIPLGNILQT